MQNIVSTLIVHWCGTGHFLWRYVLFLIWWRDTSSSVCESSSNSFQMSQMISLFFSVSKFAIDFSCCWAMQTSKKGSSWLLSDSIMNWNSLFNNIVFKNSTMLNSEFNPRLKQDRPELPAASKINWLLWQLFPATFSIFCYLRVRLHDTGPIFDPEWACSSFFITPLLTVHLSMQCLHD